MCDILCGLIPWVPTVISMLAAEGNQLAFAVGTARFVEDRGKSAWFGIGFGAITFTWIVC